MKLFKKRELAPIENIEEKRAAVKRFCEAQHRQCDKCNIQYRIPWGDDCYCTDEEVDFTYWVIYGKADPKIINGGVDSETGG